MIRPLAILSVALALAGCRTQAGAPTFDPFIGSPQVVPPPGTGSAVPSYNPQPYYSAPPPGAAPTTPSYPQPGAYPSPPPTGNYQYPPTIQPQGWQPNTSQIHYDGNVVRLDDAPGGNLSPVGAMQPSGEPSVRVPNDSRPLVDVARAASEPRPMPEAARQSATPLLASGSNAGQASPAVHYDSSPLAAPQAISAAPYAMNGYAAQAVPAHYAQPLYTSSHQYIPTSQGPPLVPQSLSGAPLAPSIDPTLLAQPSPSGVRPIWQAPQRPGVTPIYRSAVPAATPTPAYREPIYQPTSPLYADNCAPAASPTVASQPIPDPNFRTVSGESPAVLSASAASPGYARPYPVVNAGGPVANHSTNVVPATAAMPTPAQPTPTQPNPAQPNPAQPTPAASVPPPIARSQPSPPPSKYGYDAGYRWVKGQLERSQSSGEWKLRYIPIDGDTDAYGGSVAIANPEALASYKPGAFVQLSGEILHAGGNAATFAPPYRVQSAQSVE